MTSNRNPDIRLTIALFLMHSQGLRRRGLSAWEILLFWAYAADNSLIPCYSNGFGERVEAVSLSNHLSESEKCIIFKVPSFVLGCWGVIHKICIYASILHRKCRFVEGL